MADGEKFLSVDYIVTTVFTLVTSLLYPYIAQLQMSSQPTPSNTIVGEHALGSGTYGDIYPGTDNTGNITCAIKVFKQQESSGWEDTPYAKELNNLTH